VRVVIAEDSVLLREGLTRLLAEAGHEVVASAGQAEEFLREVGEHQPDVVVVDVRMPPTFTDEGLRAALVVRSTWPAVGVLVLSQYVEERYATELLSDRPQGVGYLLKDRANAAIAAELVVSEGAVEKHINNIFAKLGLAPADRDHRRVLAVLRYLGADGT